MKRRLAFCVALIASVLLGCGSNGSKGGGTGSQAKDRPSVAVKDPKPAAKDLPVVAVDQSELAKEWKADQKAAKQKFSGKRIEASGTVYYASDNVAGGQCMVILHGSQDPKKVRSLAGTIQCMLPPADEDKVNELAAGQKVKIRGKLNEFGNDVSLLECELVEVGPSTAVKATVKQLVADFKASQEEAEKKYDQKSILVEAPVADIKWEEKKRVTFVLEGKSGAKMNAVCECDINEKRRPRLETVKKGDTIKVLGTGHAGRFDDAINLGPCNLLK